MDPNLVEKISSADFNADKYVRELSQRWVGCNELRQQRKAIHALSESTNAGLKKNVYDNYSQFIKTAKEITHLENEMYQLSHLLSEQKTLLDVILNANIHSDTTISQKAEIGKTEEDKEKLEEDERRQKLTSILEKVEGCSGLLDAKGRVLLHEGDLIECDPVENNPLHKLHAYLFNDALLLALWIKDRRGPVLYKMYKMYDTSSLAVVNVKDLPPIKVAFKILAFPDTKLFVCPSVKAKNEWLECFDLARKKKLESEKLKRELQSQDSVESAASVNKPESEASHVSVESPTSQWEDNFVCEVELPDWFLESPEDLEVFIAERHFESALELLMKNKEYCKTFPKPDNPSFISVREKADQQRKNLIMTLVRELEVSPDKSLQVGLRAARRIVRLLCALDRQTQACELMLQFCTSIMKKEQKKVKREGSSVLYVNRLSTEFYSTILAVATEFTRLFESAHTCMASLVVWAHSQLAQFLSHVVKQVFVPQTPLSTIADCVTKMTAQNEQLSDCGMDLRYQMEGILQKSVSVALRDAKEKALEALRHRAADDKWRPFNLNNKASLDKLVDELKDLGVEIPSTYIRGECWLDLTVNTVAFIKMEMQMIEDCCKLLSQHIHHLIDDIIYEIFKFQLRLIDSQLQNNTQEAQVEALIQKNSAFLLDNLLPHVAMVFKANTGVPSTKLESLKSEYSHLKTPGGRPKPAPRMASKTYNNEEFI